MINASYDKEFVFHDGSRAKNLLELVSKIDFLSDHEFHQFVNHHKNDFANWTEHVLGDKHFANKLRTIPSKHETTLAIREKISNATFGNSIIKIPKVENSDEIDDLPVKEHVIEHVVEHHAVVEHHEPRHTEPIYKVHPVEHVQHRGIFSHRESRKAIQGESHEIHEKEPVKYRGLFSHRESKKTLPEVHHEVEHHESHEKTHHKHDEIDEEEINESRKAIALKESKTKHKWFHLFSKKNLSTQEMERIGRVEEDKFYPETVLEDEVGQQGRENALWVVLYFALVLLIITLLIYRLFL